MVRVIPELKGEHYWSGVASKVQRTSSVMKKRGEVKGKDLEFKGTKNNVAENWRE